MPELSRGFALHLTVSILGNCCGTWPENAPKPENRFKRATNIAGLSFSDHCCIRLDQAVILDPGWPKMAQGIRNGTHFSAQHGVQLQDGGRGGGRGFQVWCCKVAFKVWRGALELVFMLPNQAGGCNHPCACLHARMCMCHFWIRHPNGPFCAHLGQAPARSTAASFGPLGCWGAGPMAQGSSCQLKSASGCFHSWKRP